MSLQESSHLMNIDDLVTKQRKATPAQMKSPSPAETNERGSDKFHQRTVTPIPIKAPKTTAQFPIPHSIHVPQMNSCKNGEFDYVKRHVRKTSIDERARVSSACYTYSF